MSKKYLFYFSCQQESRTPQSYAQRHFLLQPQRIHSQGEKYGSALTSWKALEMQVQIQETSHDPRFPTLKDPICTCFFLFLLCALLQSSYTEPIIRRSPLLKAYVFHNHTTNLRKHTLHKQTKVHEERFFKVLDNFYHSQGILLAETFLVRNLITAFKIHIKHCTKE